MFARWLSLLGILFLPSFAWSWGQDGHMIVSKIAEAYLKPKTKKAIQELLGDRPISDSRICTWADLIRSSAMYERKYPNHRTWHYINIELQEKEADFKPDLKGDHVLGAIPKFIEIMKDSTKDTETRKEALMFVVHFMQDFHQPLHCSNRDDDKGGNMQPIKSFRGKKEERLNLHKIWDVDMVDAEKGALTNDDYVTRLLAEIKDEDRDTWHKNDLKTWIWESHMLGVKHVYQFTNGTVFPKPDDSVPELTDENYITANKPIVRTQLKRAGVRLAKVLNEAFGE